MSFLPATPSPPSRATRPPPGPALPQQSGTSLSHASFLKPKIRPSGCSRDRAKSPCRQPCRGLLTSARRLGGDHVHLMRVGRVPRVVLQHHEAPRTAQRAPEVGFPGSSERTLGGRPGTSAAAERPPAAGHGPGLGRETKWITRPGHSGLGLDRPSPAPGGAGAPP